MNLTLPQLANLLHYELSGARRLLVRLGVPLQKVKNKWILDANTSHPLCYSIQSHLKQPHLQILYSIRDLAICYDRDKKTVLKSLQELGTPLYGNHKKYVLLYDLELAQRQMGKKYQD